LNSPPPSFSFILPPPISRIVNESHFLDDNFKSFRMKVYSPKLGFEKRLDFSILF
jgi:hypothetical protein